MKQIVFLLFLFTTISCGNNNSDNKSIKDSLKILQDSVVLKDTISSSNMPDSIDILSRFFQGNTIKSHISLDFASITNISNSQNYHRIEQVCAVSVIPDTDWINKQQKSMNENDWNTIVSDYQYYEMIATDTLEKLMIPVIYASRNKRFITFVKINGEKFTIDFLKMKDAWGLILFNRTDNPVLWRSTGIDDELKIIYGK